MQPIHQFLRHSRRQYDQGILSDNNLSNNPLDQFQLWMNEAIAAGVDEPNAFDLSTVDQEGRPSSRIVLLKGIEERGFHFYTNYHSRKALEMQTSGWAAMNFFWQKQARQIRVQGRVSRLPDAENESYFASRPRESQLSAWASQQSQIVKSRQELEERVDQLRKDYADRPIPRPVHWGGYLLEPLQVEFWQGRENRLHDRFQYERTQEGWEVFRLNP